MDKVVSHDCHTFILFILFILFMDRSTVDLQVRYSKPFLIPVSCLITYYSLPDSIRQVAHQVDLVHLLLSCIIG